MIDISGIMKALSSERPAFHSEADFQHAFAWLLHERVPGARIRLERPLSVESTTLHLDLSIESADAFVAIELKYKTRRFSGSLGGEDFRLANHSANDCGRYDFLKDVHRLERIVCSVPTPKSAGYAILLTNDPGYWMPTARETVDSQFRIEDGRGVSGILSWSPDASVGTMRGRESPLCINGKYSMQWDYYSEPSAGTGKFRYLSIAVER